MHRNVQLRWIAEAEARRVEEFARAERSEPKLRVSISPANTRSTWFDRLRKLVPGLARAAARPRPVLVNRVRAFEAAAESELADWRTSAEADRVLTTLLFTDIVGSTERAAEMGDMGWRSLLDRHDAMIRQQIARFHGKEVKNLGDGFLATFDAPARAVRCASVIAETVAPLGIAVRSGLHTGEIELKSNDISGIAVHIAARIAAMAQPGQPLVSSTVRDLTTGSGLVFHDSGIHVLRGLPEGIRLYTISDIRGGAAS